jgi:hypothetical protein
MTAPFQQPQPQDPREMLQLPARFHINDIRFMMSQISRGEFCSLIGLGAVGKSTLVKMLPRWDVKMEHFGNQWTPYFINIMLDPHLFVMLNAQGRAEAGDMWMGYELMLSQLRMQLFDIEQDLRQKMPNALSIYFRSDINNLHDEIDRLYNELFRGDNLHKQAGIRHLQQAIYEVLLRDPNIRITFVFDEMEEFFDKLPPEFFQSLRGLRDMYKGRVMYITSSRAPLKELAKQHYNPQVKEQEHDYKVIESFFELFDGQTRYVSPLDTESVQFTLQRLEARMGYRIPLHQATQDLVRLSGSHAGLLRRGYKVAARYTGMYSIQNFVADLLAEKGISNQCESIYLSLSEDEREAVKLVAHGQALTHVPHAILTDLAHKHIVHQSNFLPMLEIFNIWVKQNFPI